MPAISTENLTVQYGDYYALENLSVEIEHPSLVVIMGPNGAGKTTFLKALLGLITYSGKIRIFNKPPQEARELIGYLPQRDTINMNVPLRVKDVLLLPLTSRSLSIKKEYVSLAKQNLSRVGMAEHWNSKFGALSGGQQQRVLFARALMTNPKILILDEPFSATDVKTKMSLINMLHQLKKEMTILIVLHDINPMVECTDRVLLLNKKLIAYGQVSEVINEENMAKLYGTHIPVIQRGNVCYVMGGDRHA
ncbi:MAG: metal ABC transporter ATP-binding protein [Euryarchaeota archaeon]|nr:metal ABC transporter ATP-binding protein [Euryarchaeota archaeon]